MLATVLKSTIYTHCGRESKGEGVNEIERDLMTEIM